MDIKQRGETNITQNSLGRDLARCYLFPEKSCIRKFRKGFRTQTSFKNFWKLEVTASTRKKKDLENWILWITLWDLFQGEDSANFKDFVPRCWICRENSYDCPRVVGNPQAHLAAWGKKLQMRLKRGEVRATEQWPPFRTYKTRKDPKGISIALAGVTSVCRHRQENQRLLQ